MSHYFVSSMRPMMDKQDQKMNCKSFLARGQKMYRESFSDTAGVRSPLDGV